LRIRPALAQACSPRTSRARGSLNRAQSVSRTALRYLYLYITSISTTAISGLRIISFQRTMTAISSTTRPLPSDSGSPRRP